MARHRTHVRFWPHLHLKWSIYQPIGVQAILGHPVKKWYYDPNPNRRLHGYPADTRGAKRPMLCYLAAVLGPAEPRTNKELFAASGENGSAIKERRRMNEKEKTK